ncbi:M20 family peptidase (plasmid) [Azospirillum brasilense]|uniref:M20 family peptidase n=1 Tax=Azospirillum brasilense TaxID=192 RepID=A0A4D8QTT2_AZOBR|nr:MULTISPECIES: M20/M25/M40 family metallo-hydrolase [Azospirillum]MDW7554604.1 M20/M25/M40 family metallo-hydrolase [Azospirillum brasilense]MDW7593878.1 M20/M25/M40 family metallo-hydrolase [Azospirillum brasilense]MDW7632558.1 M20/M25/M40 family metallo-hydrolase [Azospirillum brasilense]MDX5950152.1 M20/M25/M40 family metallo-hydrolase [Azospirillum brasilense]OPH11834.1 peptidase M20 [Azospirillum brasilense]
MTGADASLEREILAEIDARREELVDLCAMLVAAPSMNPPGITAQVAEIVEAYLVGQALEPEYVSIDPEAPNVVATVKGALPGPHGIFNAHMDTMQPGDENAWTVPILSLTRKHARLYGLGMGNLKGGLAAMCIGTAVLNKFRHQLAGSVSLTAVSDEVMFGTRGTEYLLRARPDLAGDYMISAEGPGSMGFAIAEKGLLWVDVEVRAEGGHSSRAQTGKTSVAQLAAFISRIDRFNDEVADLPEELSGVQAGEGGYGLRLSANVGTLDAGPVRSLMAPTARAGIDLRVPPGMTIEALQQRIEVIAADFPGLHVSFPKGWNPSWAPIDAPLVRELAAAAAETRGVATVNVVRLPGSDARHWRDRGVVAVCYGPQPALSAGVDDYANEQDVVDCAKIYVLSALRMSRRGQGR